MTESDRTDGGDVVDDSVRRDRGSVAGSRAPEDAGETTASASDVSAGAGGVSAGTAADAGGIRQGAAEPTEYGETWVYESIVGALPGIDLTDAQAVAIQLALFEVAVVVLAWVYDVRAAIPAGTAAVAVAAAGSVIMLRTGEAARRLDLPLGYRRLLFGSSIEVVLGVLAFVALVTHLFVFDPRGTATPLLESLVGPEPPVVVVYLMLLVLWDLCYRIGTSWWAAVVGLWRSVRYTFDPETGRALRRLDAMNVLFGLAQTLMLPFVVDRPVLAVAVGGHVIAVTVFSTAAYLLLETE